MVGVIGIGLSVSAATIDVTTTDPAIAADGQCSLTEAILNANDDAATHVDCAAGGGADTIELAPSETYVLDEVQVSFYGPNGLPRILSPITIEGNNSTIRRAVGAPAFRIMVVSDTGVVILNDLTLEGGDSGSTYCGGALLNAFGSATLNHTTVTGSKAPAGGGICNSSGPMTLTDCVVSSNTGSTGEGGGLLSIDDVGTPTVNIERTTVVNNTAPAGGGIATYDTEMVISDSTISGNTAFSDSGYAMCGGVGVSRGTTMINRSTVSGNSAESLVTLSGFGGGICVIDNTTTISNSTISGNEARGATTTGSATTGRGGGIMALGGAWGVPPSVDTRLIIEDSTIYANSAETYGGGISANRYAGEMAVEVELRNTIVAENYEGGGAVLGNCVEETPATIASLDFNLADDSTCNLVGTDDLVVADAMLASLADNGGPTLTHLPEAGSPVIDMGDTDCPWMDQRRYRRSTDGNGDGLAGCDCGAVEYDSYPLPVAFEHEALEAVDE
jgi:hypothetical protein